MGIVGRVRKMFGGGDPGYEFRQNLALQGCADAPQPPGGAMEEVYDAQRRIAYLTTDDRILNTIYNNAELWPFAGPLSPLNSTIKLDKHQADLKRVRWEAFIAMMKLTADPRDFEANGYEAYEGLRLYGHDRISEAVDGWKGHLCTENVRRVQVDTGKK